MTIAIIVIALIMIVAGVVLLRSSDRDKAMGPAVSSSEAEKQQVLLDVTADLAKLPPQKLTAWMIVVTLFLTLGALGGLFSVIGTDEIRQVMIGRFTRFVLIGLNVYLLVVCSGLWRLSDKLRRQVVIVSILMILSSCWGVYRLSQNKENIKEAMINKMTQDFGREAKTLSPEDRRKYETQMLPMMKQMVGATIDNSVKFAPIGVLANGMWFGFIMFYFSKPHVKARFR